MLFELIVHQVRLSAGFWKVMTHYAKQTDDENPQKLQETIDKLKRGCCFILYGEKEEISEGIELVMALDKTLNIGTAQDYSSQETQDKKKKR
jgi:carboxypeptidase C (cathepsin A)